MFCPKCGKEKAITADDTDEGELFCDEFNKEIK